MAQQELYSPDPSHHHHHHHQKLVCSKDSAMQALNSIIQLHFERTLEKKHRIDKQKKHLHRLFHLLFLFLSLVLLSLSSSSSSRLRCRHCWVPLTLLALAHLLFYSSAAHSLRCVNGLKYQRRCHKLTLAMATERLRLIRCSGADEIAAGDVEICYQEPPESYLGKFKRTWMIYFGFFVFTFGFMVAASVVVLCF